MTDQEMLRLIGRNVREARLRADLTQECLAELVGVHWKTISNIERGSYPIKLTTFARLCQFVESNADQLLGGIDPPNPERAARIKKALARKRAPMTRVSRE